jgi:hypothetical protein
MLTIMPFGRHKGERLDRLPLSYLSWLLSLDNLRHDLRRAVEREMDRRGDRIIAAAAPAARQAPRRPAPDMPMAPAAHTPRPYSPAVIHGYQLTGEEVELFEQAIMAGTLTIPLWLPVASPLPRAWHEWCQQRGRPVQIAEEASPPR